MSYTMDQCHDLKNFYSLKGQPLTIKADHARPFDDVHAIFLCLDESPENGYLHVIGSHNRGCSLRCEDILGVLKKEWVPSAFKRMAADICITSCRTPEFYGYVLDKTGYHSQATPLADIRDVEEYITLQKEIQHEIRITDTDDCLLLKIQEGQLIYPLMETMEQAKHVTMAQAM